MITYTKGYSHGQYFESYYGLPLMHILRDVPDDKRWTTADLLCIRRKP